MTITYNLAVNPKQKYFYPATYFDANLANKPLAGGLIYTRYSNDHKVDRPTYQNSNGSSPHTNPIVLDGSGEQRIYWEFDDELPDILYYIEIYDPTGTVLIDSIDNYDGVSFGSANSSSERIDINYVRNPQFSFPWFKTTYNLKEEVSANVDTPATAIGADWWFAKNNNSCTETITYNSFSVGQQDVPYNPKYYMRWNVSIGGSGETFKVIQQYYVGNINSFIGKRIGIQFYSRSASSSTLVVNLRYHFGTGGSPTADHVEQLLSQTIDPNWDRVSAILDIDDSITGTIGTNNDDFVALEFALPLNANAGATIDWTNVQLEILPNDQNSVNTFQWDTLEDQEAKLTKGWFDVKSGNVVFSYAQPGDGWMPYITGDIGNASSGASLRASEDTYKLYEAIYLRCTDGNAPVTGGRTGGGNTAADALADFDAGKAMGVPSPASRLFGSSGGISGGLTPRLPGEVGGNEETNLTTGQMAAHTHTTELMINLGNTVTVDLGGGNSVPAYTTGNWVSNTGNTTGLTPNVALTSPATTPVDLMNPYLFMPSWIKI